MIFVIPCTRSGPYFSTTVEAVQYLMYQTEWNVRTCKKETKHTLFWGVRGVREEEFPYVVAKSSAKSQKPWNPFVLQFCSWNGSFRHGEMKIWLCLYFQHVMKYIGTDFVEKSRQKCKDQKRNIFREGCSDRKEGISITANKRCSRQMLQLRCSLWFSIKFYTWH